MNYAMSRTMKALFWALIGAYALEYIAGPQMIGLFGLVPDRVVHGHWLWQLVSYMFLHGSLMHLALNLFALWMFGSVVEKSWGAEEFLKFCLICGVGGAVFNVALTPNSMDPVIGASAAIYGLLVAFAMLYPDATVYLYFIIPMKAKHVAILFGAVEFWAGVSANGGHIANLAHLGGMLTGYIYIRWWWHIKMKAQHWALDAWERVRGEPRRNVRRGPARPEEPDLDVEVDRILDKILIQGVDSLTPEEKATMKRYSARTQKHNA